MKKLVLIFIFFWVQISVAQIVNIPDANFKAALIEEGVDTNNDGEIQVSEAEAITELHIGSENISSLEGILSFINLRLLDCSKNNISSLDLGGHTKLQFLFANNNDISALNLSDVITIRTLYISSNPLGSLNISHLTNVTTLNCGATQITELDLSGLNKIRTLGCSNNLLTSIDISNLIDLESFNCSDNQLTSLDVSGFAYLQDIDCSNNDLTALDITNVINLKNLSCDGNNLTSLELSNSLNLEVLKCESNQFTSLDVSSNQKLSKLWCGFNPLETLFMKNGSELEFFNISESQNLRYICTDPEETDTIQNEIDNLGYTNCVVNSFCTFIPGGEVYNVQGSVKLDLNGDGCDADDFVFPFMQFIVTDTNGNSGIFSTNPSGDYDITLPSGSYTIDYQFPYMSYFDVSPATFSVDFPTDTSPFVQDICLTPNSSGYNDLQIVIIPLEQARPGFDARYRIVYANVGTSILSGNVTFNYDDEIIDFISSSINPDIQNTGELSWSFSNMTPFDFTFIDVTMNLNAPTETPPLNGGEILCYEATISPITNDETVIDNSFSLKQTVVNSYDPNDKTCLEGDVITPDLVGEYVHYLIRFENTGSASAVNIVVKDIIDTNKFDMESFVPMSSSHDFVTRIQNDNEVEFIFEGINLPFDDANNDGFVMFKIKTLPSLVVGDTFENSAEIYFDFNFPIITNIEQTTIDTTASTDDFALNSNITVYPNPAVDQLKIESQIQFDTIVVYDLTGKELQRIVSTENRLIQELDVSKLKSGIYYISIQSGNSKTTEKFLKI